MLDLVRGNPKRLAVLMCATIAAYASMALEAWVILRASGTPISAIGALTVETFSRVASFASAFIPANLGALEASSLAAVAAIGASGGGAALALARRLRGLFWAGIGLAIYPRGTQRTVFRHDDRVDAALPPDASQRPVLLYIPRDPGVQVSPDVRLSGLPAGERIVRSALRASYGRVVIWEPERTWAVSSRLFSRLAQQLENVTVATTLDEWRTAVGALDPSTPVTVVGAGTVVSPALLTHAALIIPEAGALLDVPAGPDWPVSGVLRAVAADATDPLTLGETLARTREDLARPTGEDVSHGRGQLAIQMIGPSDINQAEATLRRSSYKDTDAKVARFNRRISLPISIALIRTPVTANQLSVMLVAIGFYSGWLFSVGNYWAGVLGAFLSLAASVLDGCDGEIARLKYQESALGCWIETFGDYSYYFAIFVGLMVGAVRHTGYEAFYWIGSAALAGMAFTFALLIYLRARITAGQPTRLHAVAKTRFKADPSLWTKIVWRISFVATRAAMPYGIMALAIVNALPLVIILAALGSHIYWISLVTKLRDLIKDKREAVAA
jgi:phosphatidylglycerophosphate synthase